MTTYFYLPPLPATGGMAVITDVASHLTDAGEEVALVCAAPLPAELEERNRARIVPWQGFCPGPEDRYIVPEGWPNALARGLRAGSACAVFVQNHSFLHGQLPPGVRWRDMPVRFIAVSRPVDAYIRKTENREAPVIPPAVDTRIFHPGAGTRARGLRVAWMPRKNAALARQIMKGFEALLREEKKESPLWLEIDGKGRNDVARIMQAAHIFLATGFPEGFGLPPLEAMACGCIVAGFAGYGGWEYMRAFPGDYRDPVAAGWHEGANGFYAPDGDIRGAIKALKQAADLVAARHELLEETRNNAIATAGRYSPELQREAVLRLWQDADFWH